MYIFSKGQIVLETYDEGDDRRGSATLALDCEGRLRRAQGGREHEEPGRRSPQGEDQEEPGHPQLSDR